MADGTSPEDLGPIPEETEENISLIHANLDDVNLRPSRRESTERIFGQQDQRQSRSESQGATSMSPRRLRVPSLNPGIPFGTQHQTNVDAKVRNLEVQMDTLLLTNTEKMSMIEDMAKRNEEQLSVMLQRMENLREELSQSKSELYTDTEEVEDNDDAEEFRIDANTGAIRKTRKKKKKSNNSGRFSSHCKNQTKEVRGRFATKHGNFIKS